jgi:hypothetical protein
MSTARVVFAAAAVSVAACHAQVNTGSSASGPRSNPLDTLVMPYGLTCDNCLYTHTQFCVSAAAEPVAAIVSDSRLLDTERSCLGPPTGTEAPTVCAARRAYRFGHIEFLQNAGAASPSDLFEAYILYPEAYTSDFETSPSRGPLLEPDKRYVIFAGRDRRDTGFKADWYIDIACEIQNSDTQGTTP